MKSAKKVKLFIDATPLVVDKPSGVSHALAGLFAALLETTTLREKYEPIFIIPRGRKTQLGRWPGLNDCRTLTVPFSLRWLQGLARRRLLPPMDLVCGRGVYLFGDFVRWPLTSFSQSLTYVHDLCFALHPELVQPDNRRMLQRMVPWSVRRSDVVLTISQATKADIMKHWQLPDGRVVVTPLGVDMELHRPYPQTVLASIKQATHIDARQYFIFVGNIEPRKNLDRLLAAIRLLPKEYALVLIGGDGWLNEGVKTAISEALQAGWNIIRPAQFIDDVQLAILVSGAIGLVLPALYEGFGMPALEAMAAGVPAILSDTPALKEVAGDVALYCDPLSSESIAQAMRRVISLTSTERQQLIAKGHQRCRQFTWQKSAESLVAVLQ